MLPKKHEAKPERVIYRALGMSILVGTILYFIYLNLLNGTFVDSSFSVRLVAYVIGSILGLLIWFTMIAIPVWLAFGFAVYFVVGLSQPNNVKRLLVASAYVVILLVYSYLITDSGQWKGPAQLLYRLLEVALFAVPAIVMIFRVHWLDVSEKPPNKPTYDNILDAD